MSNNERMQSMRILLSLIQDKTPLTHLLATEPDLSPMSKNICFGVCRHYFRLSAIANALLQKKPKSLEVWVIILMGLYQLHYMRQPDYAVVKETVSLLDKNKTSWAKGLVNAVLRNSVRQAEDLNTRLAKQNYYQYDHPDWLIKHLKKAWPDDWQAIITANNLQPPMVLRVNQLKSSTTDYLSELTSIGLNASLHPYAAEAIVLDKPCDIDSLPGFSEGRVSVQDTAAQLAAKLLSTQPGMRVLDACAAPGGKTCHILESQPKIKNCVALDIEAKRLQKVKENLKRLELDATVIQGDGLNPEDWWDGNPFDRILIDAPCSATGVIRRHPDIKLLRQPEEIKAIAAIQQQLLERLWPLLAPGGTMVYATCSILPIENEEQISQFLSNHSDAQAQKGEQPWGRSTGHGWQILPGEHNMDGFFYSVLYKEHARNKDK